jgi:hypothetical protein
MTNDLDSLPSASPDQRRRLEAEMTEAWHDIAAIAEHFQESYGSPWGKAGVFRGRWRKALIRKERRLINAIESGL